MRISFCGSESLSNLVRETCDHEICDQAQVKRDMGNLSRIVKRCEYHPSRSIRQSRWLVGWLVGALPHKW